MNESLSLPILQVETTGLLTQLGRAISAELLKMRRTLALWMTIIAPATIAGLQLILLLQRDEIIRSDTTAWIYLARQNLTFWALLMQPLYITLETALIAQVDHSGDHWKHLFTLPVSRWVLYTAKLIVNLILIGISFGVLFGLTLISGGIINMFRPGIGFGDGIPLGDIAAMTVLAFLGAWLVIVIHHWVSLRWRSFVVACGFGIVMTIAGILVINIGSGGFYPWTTSAVIVTSIREGEPYLQYLIFGGGGGLVAAVLGALEFSSRESV